MNRIAVLFFSSCALAGAQNAAPRQIDYGFEQRVRNENWNNLFDYNDTLDDQRVQIRYRTRVWLKAPLTSDIDVNVGLTRKPTRSSSPAPPGVSTRSSSKPPTSTSRNCSSPASRSKSGARTS